MSMTLFLALASAAGAAEVAATVQVEWGVEPKRAVIVDQRAWPCTSTSCSVRVIDTPYLKARACRAIARYAGRVTSFSTPSGHLSAQELARCNGERS